MSNATAQFCHKVLAPEAPPLLQNGKIVLQAYHIGWIISGILTLIAMITSFWLISKHLQWYTNKREQRYLVRLLFMVPLYAVISFGSFLFWNHATPIILVRDAYEAIVLTAFFYLLLMYLSHDPEEQRRIFLKRGMSVEADAMALRNGEKIMQWCFPLGFVKWKPRDGLYFLQLMKWGILQYCVIRPTSTLAAVILDYMGLYCESSWGLGWGHIYITIIMSISVSIAMYCLIQLYMTVAVELSSHKPLLKLFSVKAVVFLTFWQATFLSLLSMFGVVHAVKYMTTEDVNIGIGAVLETFEMMIFAFLHIRAFSFKPYQQPQTKLDEFVFPSRTPQWRSLGHAMDFRETFREIWIGCVYMFDRARGKEPMTDFGVIRETHFVGAFGRERALPGRKSEWSYDQSQSDRKALTDDDPTFPSVEIEVDQEIEVEIEGQRQWLLLDRYDQHGLHPKREKSEGLQEQIDRELERLGHAMDNQGDNQRSEPHPGRQRSWWRNIYNRISQTGKEYEDTGPEQSEHRNFPRLLSTGRSIQANTELRHMNYELDDQPPRSKLVPVTEYYLNGPSAHRNLDNKVPISPREQRPVRRFPLSLDDNQEGQYEQETNFAISPEMVDERASILTPLGFYLPSPEPISSGDAFRLTFGGPLSPKFPIRSPNDPVQENAFRQPVRYPSRRQGGSSSRPPRMTLTMPAPLDPLHPSNLQKNPESKWTVPPPTPPKDVVQVQVTRNNNTSSQATPNSKRSSIHRREAAGALQDQLIRQTYESRPFPPSSRARYSGLPFESITDLVHVPTVHHFKQSRKPPPAF